MTQTRHVVVSVRTSHVVIGDNFNDSALSQAVVASTPIDASGSEVVFPRVASTSTRADLWWTLTVPCGRAEYVGLVGSVVFLGLPSLVHVGSFDSWGGYFIKVLMVSKYYSYFDCN